MKWKSKVVLSTLLACGMHLSALALTINDAGVVGTVKGLQGDNQNEEYAYAQHLLDLPANTVNNLFTDAASGVEHTYNTSSTEYSGTITGPGTEGGGLTVSGYEYVLAKYDGKNAGYVLFYVGGGTINLPEFSYSIWGDNAEQFQISHWTGFNPASVPDAGSGLALLGMAMAGIGLLRRKVS
jgi:hypothetical protein